MKRLLRRSTPGLPDYTALILFAIAYLATLALVVAPEWLLLMP